jgi:hypothetical protein
MHEAITAAGKAVAAAPIKRVHPTSREHQAHRGSGGTRE